jgi:hypothetical protein
VVFVLIVCVDLELLRYIWRREETGQDGSSVKGGGRRSRCYLSPMVTGDQHRASDRLSPMHRHSQW